MSKHRRPHGQYGRNTPDWFFDRMMGGTSEGNQVAAQYSFVALYNDATDGSLLHVWGLQIWAQSVTAYAGLRLFTGTQGTLQPNKSFNLYPYGQQLAGQIYAGAAASVPGNLFFTMSGGNTPTVWPATYPIAILPPGMSLVVNGSLVNVAVLAAFTWLVMGQNQGFY